jgi:hypothetical protein
MPLWHLLVKWRSYIAIADDKSSLVWQFQLSNSFALTFKALPSAKCPFVNLRENERTPMQPARLLSFAGFCYSR